LRQLLRTCLVAALVVAALAPAGAQPRAEAPTQEGRIIFVGSSIFRRWSNLETQMAPLPVIKRAFDGFQTADVLGIMGRAVLPFRPRVVVYYCGSNDVDTGETPERIVGRIRQFVEGVHEALPATRVIFVSINRSPQQRDVWDVINTVNRQVDAYAAKTAYFQYVDVNPALMDAEGMPRLELFQPDERHLRPAGYDAYTRVLKPIVTTAFESVP
jgi:hypothetical protein